MSEKNETMKLAFQTKFMCKKFYKQFVLTVLCLTILQTNTIEIVAQTRKTKGATIKSAKTKSATNPIVVSPDTVWENFVLAIERRNVAQLKAVLSKGMRDGGWIEEIPFNLWMLFVNPTSRDYKIVNVETDVHTASLRIQKPGIEQTFGFYFVKENDAWKFGTGEETYAGYNRDIKERNDDFDLKTIVVPIREKRRSRNRRKGRKGRKGGKAVVIPENIIVPVRAKPEDAPPPTETKKQVGADEKATETKSAEAIIEPQPNPLIPAACRDKLELFRNKYAVEINADYSSPAATIKTLVAALECRKLEVGNRAYSSRILNRLNNSGSVRTNSLFLILNAYHGTVIQKTGEIGDVQINGNTARATIKNFPDEKAYQIDFVKEDDEWKVDLDFDEFLRKAESARDPDALMFDLLDFAGNIESKPSR
ncbi:MAG: hypothetical protein H7Z37_10225 [Pyrinomonadaceae bacterium]|nr:hypothetical protein [Pyrinomonadaceae bacterium]